MMLAGLSSRAPREFPLAHLANAAQDIDAIETGQEPVQQYQIDGSADSL